MAKNLTLLITGLVMIGAAAVLNEQAPSPKDIEPADQIQLARINAPKPTATALATSLPIPSRMPPVHAGRPSPLSSASPSASGSPSLPPCPSASPNPNGFVRIRIKPSGTPEPCASVSPSPSPSPSDSGSPSPSPSASPSGSGSPTTAAELHKQAIVVDTHVDIPYWLSEQHISLRSNSRQVSLEKLKTGGVDVVFFSIMVYPQRYGKIAKNQADYIIQVLKRELAKNSDLVELATSYADIERILAKGKIAGLMGMEGGEPIENSVDNVNHFYQQGVRYISPTWSVNNQLADSSGAAKARWNGLSPLGKQVIQRMNQLGMLIDVSHVSDATFNDILKLTTQPVIASHSGVDGMRLSPRNLSDAMLKQLATNGGALGVLFYPPFLEPTGRANIASVVNHIDYAVKVAGVDHVGLGSDFDGLDTPPPKGLEDAAHFPAITVELKKRGYKDADILKILGGNFMHVFESVLR